MTAPAFAISHSFQDVITGAKWVITFRRTFGPSGMIFDVYTDDGRRGRIIVTQGPAASEADDWLHASISFPDSDPTYRDLVLLHRAVFGRRRYAYQVFAPAQDHVNIHEHALHLWGAPDGTPQLPDFGYVGSI